MGLFDSIGGWFRNVTTPDPPPFTPTYESPIGTLLQSNTRFWVNPKHFADDDTATAMATKLGADRIEMRPYEGTSANAVVNMGERFLIFRAGYVALDAGNAEIRIGRELAENAGEMADYLARNGEQLGIQMARRMIYIDSQVVAG